MAPDYFAAVDAIEGLQQVRSPVQLGSEVANALGFDWFHYHETSRKTQLTNGPKAWDQRYRSQNYEELDPIRRRARSARQAISWSSADACSTHDEAVASFYSDSARHGMGRGFIVPLIGGFGRDVYFCFGKETDGYEAAPVKIDPSIYSVCAKLDSLFCSDASLTPRDALLTAQEVLCLKWTAAGKTMSEIATIMGLRRRTVEFHLTNVREKLGTTTTAHSVAEAMRRGQIS